MRQCGVFCWSSSVQQGAGRPGASWCDIVKNEDSGSQSTEEGAGARGWTLAWARRSRKRKFIQQNHSMVARPGDWWCRATGGNIVTPWSHQILGILLSISSCIFFSFFVFLVCRATRDQMTGVAMGFHFQWAAAPWTPFLLVYFYVYFMMFASKNWPLWVWHGE